ncbi:hypothetical protein TARUN_2749 [Trichoderma arundinaceum]|uniref:Uncharacterized protein n=1 Tax=Trichoderma arundinaceum TaxID=490622 RepID=A0A395NU56_TRIAR|nr:hypothetical protein TARUN_2749 [Trichoderma arundinaceum]
MLWPPPPSTLGAQCCRAHLRFSSQYGAHVALPYFTAFSAPVDGEWTERYVGVARTTGCGGHAVPSTARRHAPCECAPLAATPVRNIPIPPSRLQGSKLDTVDVSPTPMASIQRDVLGRSARCAIAVQVASTSMHVRGRSQRRYEVRGTANNFCSCSKLATEQPGARAREAEQNVCERSVQVEEEEEEEERQPDTRSKNKRKTARPQPTIGSALVFRIPGLLDAPPPLPLSLSLGL